MSRKGGIRYVSRAAYQEMVDHNGGHPLGFAPRRRGTWLVKIKYQRGSLRTYTVGKTRNRKQANHWADQLRAALRDAISKDSWSDVLVVKVVRLRKKKRKA